MWLLCVGLVMALVLGQPAKAGSGNEHHSAVTLEAAVTPEQQSSASPACHPGVVCTALALLESLDSMQSAMVRAVLQPGSERPQRRFAGPAITLPPPRTLT
ncbi:MAG: hypothetical protein B7Y02_10600 [Rhodobacterales bacterium 17-64-5]|nr:MAG: hypothetical protein B7Y02_10600 [Rhodobacterales bacterium 17-64-5]